MICPGLSKKLTGIFVFSADAFCKLEKRALLLMLVLSFEKLHSQLPVRQDFILNCDWQTIANDTNPQAFDGFEKLCFNTSTWQTINLPHTWDRYEGYRRLKHGNRHGYAWYRKEFHVDRENDGKRFFLWFEGVGSYATVWINGQNAGYHDGGRTSFTIDITEFVHFNETNLLAVRADHPVNIRDLPWVCGGCSDEWGFSEGSQPMGIFRPVHLVITDQVRIEPFGVHIWNDTSVNEKSATVYIEIEVRNYGTGSGNISVLNRMMDQEGSVIASTRCDEKVQGGRTKIIRPDPFHIADPVLWSPDKPYLYRVETKLTENGMTIDSMLSVYGIRWISWPGGNTLGDNRFLLNGKPVFINGTAEYEHNMGMSHAFSNEQIRTRVMQVQAAGFNAFRDAHQPHNLHYQALLDSMGILWWPQFAAHIWFDNAEFRENFKMLLKDWVKERRNSPSIILWGLENESTLPTDFAEECADIIRELDPTASAQRLITTCNGGTGTDWNVIQNWSGTYGGDPYAYAEEMQRELLNGEYGAWRSIDLHTEGPFVQDGPFSEDRMTQLMEIKIRLAESVKDKCCGQFQWLLASHENPGRIQNGEGLRDIDRIGPVNYKGLFTLWGEPLDAFYMYRANYASKDREPMVYIVSHTWPDRWISPGIKDSILVYSNCDEVELFNDIKSLSFGKKKRAGKGTHFQWDSIDLQDNVLFAVGYVNDSAVAEDCVVLYHLPEAHDMAVLRSEPSDIIAPRQGFNYIYRVNCGGPEYLDSYNNMWSPDLHKTSDSVWGSRSWTDEFEDLPAFYGSRRRTFDPITGTADWELFQSFRYGRDKLKFEFPLPDGEYLVELYFTEPWYGTGGGLDCRGWRIFDVAVNQEVIIKNLDIWEETGHDHALKKTIMAEVTGGQLSITFPQVLSGQAIISAIAIASENHGLCPAPEATRIIENLKTYDKPMSPNFTVQSWLDTGDKQYAGGMTCFSTLPSYLYGAEWIRTPGSINTAADTIATFDIPLESDVYVAFSRELTEKPVWLKGYAFTGTQLVTDENGGSTCYIYGSRFAAGTQIILGNMGNEKGEERMYTVVVCPVTGMEQPGDQRTVRHYQAEDAGLHGPGLKTGSLDGVRYVAFNNPSEDNIDWSINVGLAGRYSFRIRYMNSTNETIPMNLILSSPDGRVLKQEWLNFPDSNNSWQILSTDSGSEINAGTYSLILSVSGKINLLVDEVAVQ
jgi:beta-galactosidase